MMLSIDRQAEKIRRRDHLIRQLYVLILCLASIIVLLALIIFGMTRTAAANNVCLTKKEARVLWPKQHIYWYSKDHCWSNRRHGPPRGLKFDPVFNKAHAEEPSAQEKKPDRSGRAIIKIVKAEDYNELDAAADVDTFFNAKPFTYQAYVMDLERYRATNWYRHIWDPK